MALDGNGRYCALSPREGAKLIVAECCRNLSTVGALPVAATNNLNFGNPERPEIMAQLVETIEGIGEACRFFDTPITGGNVSLYNETLGEAIWPSPVMGIVGLMKTAAPMTIPFKNESRTVMLLGGLGSCDATRFGGTQYAKVDPEQDVGIAAGARYGVREAGAVCDSRRLWRTGMPNRRTIYRMEGWRSRSRNAAQAGSARRLRFPASFLPKWPCFTRGLLESLYRPPLPDVVEKNCHALGGRFACGSALQ